MRDIYYIYIYIYIINMWKITGALNLDGFQAVARPTPFWDMKLHRSKRAWCPALRRTSEMTCLLNEFYEKPIETCGMDANFRGQPGHLHSDSRASKFHQWVFSDHLLFGDAISVVMSFWAPWMLVVWTQLDSNPEDLQRTDPGLVGVARGTQIQTGGASLKSFSLLAGHIFFIR